MYSVKLLTLYWTTHWIVSLSTWHPSSPAIYEQAKLPHEWERSEVSVTIGGELTGSFVIECTIPFQHQETPSRSKQLDLCIKNYMRISNIHKTKHIFNCSIARGKLWSINIFVIAVCLKYLALNIDRWLKVYSKVVMYQE